MKKIEFPVKRLAIVIINTLVILNLNAAPTAPTAPTAPAAPTAPTAPTASGLSNKIISKKASERARATVVGSEFLKAVQKGSVKESSTTVQPDYLLKPG